MNGAVRKRLTRNGRDATPRFVFSKMPIEMPRFQQTESPRKRDQGAKCLAFNPFVNGLFGAHEGEVINTGGNSMEAIGLLVTLEARSGKEAEAEAFLKSAQPLAGNESGTLKWYAIKLGPGKFGIFDTFANEAGRNAHLSGEIAKALGARANELLAVPPQIEKVEVLASTPLKG